LSLPYRAELDGLRALSMLAVVVYHFPIAHGPLPGGFIGVDVFFVLSGALITQLLLTEEAATKTIALGRFTIRRLRRLYPAMIAMIALTTLASIVIYPREIRHQTLHDAAFCAAYLGTFLSMHGRIRFFGHAWSLSIEEAFYLVWPTLLLVVRTTRARILLCILVILACFAQRVHLWLDDFVPAQRIWVALDTRADAIALGCLVGLGLDRGLARAKTLFLWAAPLAAIGLCALARFADRRTDAYVVWGYPLTAALAAIVVARLFLAPPKILAFAPLTWLGKLSYSLYLWHLPILTIGDEIRWPIPVSLAVSLIVASMSYYAIERPLRAPSQRAYGPRSRAI